MCNNLLQEHICRLAGVHLPGIDCLSDDQILPILLAMDDPKSLLNCGRASPRLYRLVCDPEVWRHLLKGIGFSKKQMEELVLFAKGLFGISGSPEMMSEIVKEAARRSQPDSLVSKHIIKLTIAIQSWGAPDTFEVDGSYLKELTRVAKAVGAKFTIVEVDNSETGFRRFPKPIFDLIDAHVARQDARLDNVSLNNASLSGGFIDSRK